MKFSRIIANSGEWLSGDGPNRQIVVSSRVRLARNLRDKHGASTAWVAKRMRLNSASYLRKLLSES